MAQKDYFIDIKKGLKPLLNSDKLLLIIANNVRAEMTERVWSRGELTNGSKLDPYNAKYLALKTKIGRKNPFDLTGQLKKSFGLPKKEGNEWVIRFAETKRIKLKSAKIKHRKTTSFDTALRNPELAGYLEDNHGEIFGLSKREGEIIDETINEFLNNI